MALVRWNANRELDSLQREMNRLFDDVFTLSPRQNSFSEFVPAAELEEQDDAYHLRLEVPGIKKDDLDIQVTANSVAISGERTSSTQAKDDRVTRSEFRYGSFNRVIAMPGQIDHQNVVANYQDGVLSLTLPKAEEEKHKIVKVNIG